MYFNNHLKLLMYTTKRHFWVAFIWPTLLLSKSSPSFQFHDLRNRWHSQKKAVRCRFLPCLTKQQRKVPTDPMQCGVMHWCSDALLSAPAFANWGALLQCAQRGASLALFSFVIIFNLRLFIGGHHNNANYAGSQWGSGGAYVAHNSIDKRGNTMNPKYYVHWQPI